MSGSSEFGIGLANKRSSRNVLNQSAGRSNIFGEPNEYKPNGRTHYNRNHNTEIQNCFQYQEPVTEKLMPMIEKPEKVQEKEETDFKQVEQHVVDAKAAQEEKPENVQEKEETEVNQVEQHVVEAKAAQEEKPEKVQEKEDTGFKQVEQHVVEAKAMQEEKKTEPKSQPAPQRVHVPPGGFSAGFW